MGIADIAAQAAAQSADTADEAVHVEELGGRTFEFTWITRWPVERYERMLAGETSGPLGEALADNLDEWEPFKAWAEFADAFADEAGVPLTPTHITAMCEDWWRKEGMPGGDVMGNSRGSARPRRSTGKR